MKALIVKKPWIDYILDGIKTWEIRGSKTNIRGKIELIQSGSGLVVGCCEIIDCKQLSFEDYINNKDKHKISDTTCLPYKYHFATNGWCRYENGISQSRSQQSFNYQRLL